MNLTGKNVHFRRQRNHTRPTVALVLMMVVVASMFMLRAVESQSIRSPFEPTPTATRVTLSYAQEGETLFQAGNLPAAITAYKEAIRLDPKNTTIMVELARFEVYSSATMSTDAEKRTRIEEALTLINAALKLAPDDSNVHAVRAFVLDWYANPNLVGDKAEKYLTEADQEANKALNIDNQNVLAKAYYAEILVDEKKWLQADTYIRQALDAAPGLSAEEQSRVLMDVHRVNAYVQETLGDYGKAIDEYLAAAKITPNLTFLYIDAGTNYRQLKQYDQALTQYERAVFINEQLGIKDPIPYIAIGKTYTQTGEFFAAGQNVRKALTYNPTNQDVYGALGVIYFQSRNYENAIDALKCTVRGCDAALSCKVRNRGQDCTQEQTSQSVALQPLPLSGSTVVYYFTYGSVLAGMHNPSNNYCKEAVAVMKDIRAKYSADTTIISIISKSEKICESFGITE
jgi:tetratricopeptide (TPR) repeat protein